MGRRTKLILLLAGVGVVLSAAVMLFTDAEPVYEGRKLSYWCEQYVSDFSSSHIRYMEGQPGKAICQIGTNALPCLLEWIAYNPPRWRLRLSDAPGPWSKWIPAWATVQPGDRRAEAAMFAFFALGPEARPAIPRLAELARHHEETIGYRAVVALASVGPDAIPEFAAMTTNTNLPPALRCHAFWGLGKIQAAKANITVADLGTNGAPVVTALLNDLDHQYVALALQAADLLALLKPEFPQVLGALTNALRDPRVEVRQRAVRVLGFYGPEASAAVPALLTVLSDADFDVREVATNALMSIAPQALTNPPAQ